MPLTAGGARSEHRVLTKTSRHRATCAAAFIGATIFGASLNARATSPCMQIAEVLKLRVNGVTVDDTPHPFVSEAADCKPQPLTPEAGPGCFDLQVVGRGNGRIDARLYDPERRAAHELKLVEQ